LKKNKTYTMSERTLERLEVVSKELGLGYSAVVNLAIDNLFHKHTPQNLAEVIAEQRVKGVKK
jgi:hypothetical protein